MPSLLTHALKQEISLPVAHLLVLVRTAPQLFELPTSRNLKDGLKRLDKRSSGLLGEGSGLPQEDLLSHLVDGLFCSHRLPSPSVLLRASEPTAVVFGLLLVGGRRNIVVAPGCAFRIGGLITLVLLCTLFGVVEPGVGELVRQTAFALSDLVDEGPDVGAAPTAGACGAGSAKGHLLAAVALKGDVGRMPLVDLTKRHFAVLVVSFDALEDLHHGLLPFLLPFVRQFSRVGSCPKSSRQAGSDPRPSTRCHVCRVALTPYTVAR